MSFKEKINTIIFALKLSNDFDRVIYFIVLLKCLINSVLPLIPTYFSAMIVDELAGDRNIKTLVIYGVLMAALTAIFGYARQLVERAYDDRCESLRWNEGKIFQKYIIGKDFELLEDTDFQGTVKSYRTVYQNNYGIYPNLWYYASDFFTGFLSLVFSLIIVGPTIVKCFDFDNSSFISSYKPALILLAVVVVLGGIMLIIGNRYTNEITKMNLAWNRNFAQFLYWHMFPERYQRGKEIRIYNANDLILKKQNEFAVGQEKMTTDLRIRTVKYQILTESLQMILMGCFYLFVALRAYSGVFGIGSFVLFLGASLHIANGVNLFGEITQLLGFSAEHISYLKKIVETPNRKHRGTLPVEKRNDNKYDIEFKNVSFKYPGTDTYVLKNFNAKLEIGHHMAVVGQNGSGKTTFIKLLCRLYDVTEGEITLNGINIKKYDLNEYMSLFSVVFQDFQLFSVPLSQNVTTSLEYDKEKLFDCLDKAGIRERVEEMPQGENSVIYKDFDENGIEISGGEAQKIALARALYKDAPFVILDEPTSALDPISEFEIYQRFNNFVGEKTAIYISHRLSSCRFCNEILVFDGGRIVQQGSHDDLLKDTNGKYYRLWSAQSQYYI